MPPSYLAACAATLSLPLFCAPLQATQNLSDPPADSWFNPGSEYLDFGGYVDPWIFVSVPELGVYSLREVLEIGTPGWQAFVDFGLPFEGYERINIFSTDPTQRNTGIVVLMPEQHCLGDFNDDYIVDSYDMLPFAQAYLDGDPAADLNFDDIIDVFDQLMFIQLATMGCVVI